MSFGFNVGDIIAATNLSKDASYYADEVAGISTPTEKQLARQKLLQAQKKWGARIGQASKPPAVPSKRKRTPEPRPSMYMRYTISQDCSNDPDVEHKRKLIAVQSRTFSFPNRTTTLRQNGPVRNVSRYISLNLKPKSNEKIALGKPASPTTVLRAITRTQESPCDKCHRRNCDCVWADGEIRIRLE